MNIDKRKKATIATKLQKAMHVVTLLDFALAGITSYQFLTEYSLKCLEYELIKNLQFSVFPKYFKDQ